MASEGDPRVLFVMNLVLSVLSAAVMVGMLSFVGVVEWSSRSVALTAAFLMIVTWLVVLR